MGRVSVWSYRCCMFVSCMHPVAVLNAGDWAREGGVMYVCVVSLDYLCRWQVQVSVYCARRIPAYLRCTLCSIRLHLIDIGFLPCICLWQISQIQTCLCVVVGLGFVST